jgi:hypothetical protein
VIRGKAYPPLRRRAQQGYAFLIVVFFTTVLLVSAMAVSSSILTEGRRQKEEELVWRGNQYVRGIKLYYRKLGRFPTSLEDLTKAQVGDLHFMRQAYKDPVNKEDGSWRLLYVGANGQLVGSLKPQQSNSLLPGSSGGFGTPASALNGPSTTSSGFGSPSTAVPGGASGFASGTQNSTAPGSAAAPPANGQNDPLLNPPADSGSPTSIIGGNIIGVASKVNQHSLRIYEKAKNYKLFEFYWDPSKDLAAAIQNGTQAGGVPGGAPIGTPVAPTGGQPGNPGINGGIGGAPQPPTQAPAPQPAPQQ